MFQGLLRFWRIPYVLLWLTLFVLFNIEHDDLVIRSDNMHTDAVRSFGIGMFIFGICYIVGALITGGSFVVWRLVPVDSRDVSSAKQWFALCHTTVGAAIGTWLAAASLGLL